MEVFATWYKVIKYLFYFQKNELDIGKVIDVTVGSADRIIQVWEY